MYRMTFDEYDRLVELGNITSTTAWTPEAVDQLIKDMSDNEDILWRFLVRIGESETIPKDVRKYIQGVLRKNIELYDEEGSDANLHNTTE